MQESLEILNRSRLSSLLIETMVEANILIERDVAIKRAKRTLKELQEEFYTCIILKTLQKNRLKAICKHIDSLDDLIEYKLENQ